MLFSITRIIFWGILLIISFYFIKKRNIKNKKKIIVILFLLYSLCLSFSSFILIENIFISFKKPEEAYRYKHTGKPQLVINGEKTSFVIGKKGNIETSTIIPKTSNGWKLSNPNHTKKIQYITSDKIIINIYRYKNSDEYYIVVFDMNGGLSNIKDNCNSNFYHIESMVTTDKKYYRYYAYINNFNDKYEINIGERKIKVN